MSGCSLSFLPLGGPCPPKDLGEGATVEREKKTLESRVIQKPQAGPCHSDPPVTQAGHSAPVLEAPPPCSLPSFFFFLFPICCLLALYFVSSKATVQVTSAFAPSHLMPYSGNLGPVEGLWPVCCACLLRSRPLRDGRVRLRLSWVKNISAGSLSALHPAFEKGTCVCQLGCFGEESRRV